MDLLLIEMIPMAYRLASELATPGQDGVKPTDEDEQREAAFRRLETLGYRVGQGLVERSAAPFVCREPCLGILNAHDWVLRTDSRGIDQDLRIHWT